MSNDLRRIQVRHWMLVLCSALGLQLTRHAGAGSVLLGGSWIGFSMMLYQTLYPAVVQNRRPRLAIGLLFGKVGAFAGLCWLVFTSKVSIDPVGFATGVTCLPIAVVWGGWRRG